MYQEFLVKIEEMKQHLAEESKKVELLEKRLKAEQHTKAMLEEDYLHVVEQLQGIRQGVTSFA